MKKVIFISILIWFNQTYVAAQDSTAIANQIKNLELEETKALLSHDFESLKNLWAEDFMVNNPYNMVVKNREEVFERVREGIINYEKFYRETESIMVLDDIVIVMGEETVHPIGDAPMAGEIVKRRYTNIWRKIDGKWQVQARHANIICTP